MKFTHCIAAAAMLGAALSAQALDTSAVPTVTKLSAVPATGLFVGNSFTYYNCGINGYVAGLAKAAQFPWKARIVTIAGAPLSFHEVDAYLRVHERDRLIRSKGRPFDVVFLQGQSNEPINVKDPTAIPTFKKYLAQHIATVRATGAEPVAVMTWALKDKPEQTRQLADAITEQANASKAAVLPVGLAFAESLKQRPDLILHAPDKRHPSAAGSYLYAACVYSFIAGKSPEGLAYAGHCEKPLAEADYKHLQKVAWKVVSEFNGWKQ